MNTHTATTSDDASRPPETVGNLDDQPDPRQLAPDTEERVPDEAGYGYGV